MTGTSLADLWRLAQRRAELYKDTRDPRARDEAAALLWQALVAEGGIIAHKKLPHWQPRPADDVAGDAAASLLSAQGFTLMLEEHDANKGASLRTWLAQKLTWKIQHYAEKERWYDVPPPSPQDDDGQAPTLTPGEAAQETAVRDQGAGDDLDRVLINSEFWRIARRELSADEFEALRAHLAGFSNAEAAEQLGVPYGTYMDRMARVRAKLSMVYKDLPPDPTGEPA